MAIPRAARQAGRINVTEPVERGHPLNIGLVSWHLAVPGQAGDACRDIAGGKGYPVTSAFGGFSWAAGRNGFLAVDSQKARAFIPAIVTAVPMTMCGWVWYSSAGGLVMGISNPNGFSAWSLSGAGSADTVFLYRLTDSGGTSTDVAGTTAYVTGRWYFVCSTSASDSDHKLYVDGRLEASSTTLRSPSSVTSTYFGEVSTNAGSQFGLYGRTADHRLYSRALSASEVWALYEQGMSGHPSTLRRLSSSAFFLPTTPAITWPAMAGASTIPHGNQWRPQRRR